MNHYRNILMMGFMMASKMMRRGLALVLLISLMGCGEKIGPGTAAPGDAAVIKASVGIATVTQQPFLYEAVGTITARTAMSSVPAGISARGIGMT